MPDKPTLASDAKPAVDTFLHSLKPEVRRSFLGLRALLINLGPDVHEEAQPDHVRYARKRTFAEARLVRNKLILAFPEGNRLSDPEGKLLRKGDERHLRVEANEELDGHVQQFVREAYRQARE